MGKRLLGDSAGQNTNSAANNSFTLTLDHLAQLVSSSGPTGVSSADYVRDCVQASEHARILLCSQTHLVVRLGPDRSGGVVLAYDLTLPPKPQEDWTAAPVLTGRTVCGRGVTGSMPFKASIEWGVSYWASSDLAFVLDSLEKHCRDTLEPGMQSLDASAGLALERLDDLPPLRPSPAARQACNGILKREPGPMEINGPSGSWNVLGAPVIAIGQGAPAAAYDAVETISLRQIMACTALMRRVAAALS